MTLSNNRVTRVLRNLTFLVPHFRGKKTLSSLVPRLYHSLVKRVVVTATCDLLLCFLVKVPDVLVHSCGLVQLEGT